MFSHKLTSCLSLCKDGGLVTDGQKAFQPGILPLLTGMGRLWVTFFHSWFQFSSILPVFSGLFCPNIPVGPAKE